MAKLALTLPQALSRATAAYYAGNLVEAEQLCQQIINAKPDSLDALHLLAVVQSSLGKKDAALASYDRALAVRPDLAEALSNRGNVLRELKRLDEALASFDRAIALRPDHAESLCNRGLILHQLERFADALESYDRALTVRPDYAEALSNRGLALYEQKRFEEALESYDRALSLRPDVPETLSNRGIALTEMKRFEEALESYNRALTLRPNHAESLSNRGLILHHLKRFDEALASYDRALAVQPDYAEALSNRGLALHELKRFEEALTSYDRALALRPDYAVAHSNRGVTLHELRRLDEALASYDRALTARPDYAEALNNRGVALQGLKRFDEALAGYDRALAVQPDYAEALNNRGNVLQDLKQFDEALASYRRALAAKPDHADAFSGIASCIKKLCDWHRAGDIAAEMVSRVSEKRSIISPLVLLGYSGDPLVQLQCARNYVAAKVPSILQPLWTGTIRRHDKVRIAYLSADFYQHATAYLIAELFERHDRSRFEIIGVSFGADDTSEMRKRLIAAFDGFYDVRGKSDEDAAKLLHGLQIDIAVDLKGHTQDARPGILARRPTPISVSYLGYPGTMGTEFIDYVIADGTVAPFEHQPFYTEKIVHLPDSYQVNDSKRKSAEWTPTRQEAGLPENGFVFCCFNNNWKITPDIFAVWMRLLSQVAGSVLWLLGDNPSTTRNLRKQAQASGVDPARLVFADRLPVERHLARHRLADLFLDTLLYNAHTTASDALWTGVPVVTCMGASFAGRVAASLLKAIGLPDLVTHSIEDYEALALQLAKNAARLAEFRNRLASHRATYPLFDTDRFRRHIEAAYCQMWQIWQRGEQPRGFAVEGGAVHDPNAGRVLARALAAFKSGKLKRAETLGRQVLERSASDFDALYLLGLIEAKRGRLDGALGFWDKARVVKPQDLELLMNASATLRRLKRPADALKIYEEVIRIKPDHADAYCNRGTALHELKRFDAALASYDRALAVRLDFVEALSNRGLTLQELKRFDDALASYNRVLALRPDFAEVLSNRGLTLNRLQRPDEALASYDRALAVRPNFAEALSNRGNALKALKRFEEAVASYDRALAARPDYAEALANRGVSLHELKRFDEAVASYDRALALRPDFAEVHWNEALLRLLTGDFDRGWAKYEWRWKNEALGLRVRNFSQPRWLDVEALDGKTILIYSEQAFGDTIQFCRYVPLLAARGARVILEVESPLQALMTSLAGAAQVISRGNALPDFDIHCPLLSLPLAFGTRLETIPSATPYLRASSGAVIEWDKRLGPKHRLRIGLAWSGRPSPPHRAINLSALLALCDVDATFISLQKDVRADDAAVLREHGELINFGEALKDFADTAALISNLDLVISVDTGVAHLAGALGKPVWVLLPFVPDWRWLLDRNDSPWYPTARLFLQDESRTWHGVIARVHAALDGLVRSRS